MHVERKWHILLTIFFLLISSGQCMDSKEVKQNERRTLLDLILQVIKDSQQRDKPVSRRCGSGLHTSAQDFKSSSREKPLYVPRLDNTRLIDIVPRDAHLKDKFIQHFGGHVKFSSECKTHFHRLYHTTRDCSRPAWEQSFLVLMQFKEITKIKRLQKVCKIANAISNESALHAVIGFVCRHITEEGSMRCQGSAFKPTADMRTFFLCVFIVSMFLLLVLS